MYQGHKVVPWCTRCGTALSSHELAQGYNEVTDISVYIKFKLLPKQKITSFKTDDLTFVLSWTTTPWTLPGNVALAVGADIDYGIYEQKNGEKLIVARELAGTITGLEISKEIAKVKGKNLVGLEYRPLFEIEKLRTSTAYKIYPANFVTTTDGTGVVHTAVMYGEDDYNLGKKVGLPQHHTVNERGFFTKDVKGFAGEHVKDKKTEEKIIEQLKNSGELLKTLPYTHEYPYCWRCDTPLIYYARNAWFVEMSKVKKLLLAGNSKINWVPQYIKEGRFGEWLSDVKDWNFSRERYWGTPLPIWKCDKCGHQKAVGSYKEITDQLPKSFNRYVLIRHGEAGHNVANVINSDPKDKDKYPLTIKGKNEVKRSVSKLKKNLPKIDLIISSDFIRAKETAQIVADVFGVKKVNTDPHLREIYTGEFDGANVSRYHEYYSSIEEKFMKQPPKGESLRDVSQRLYEFIQGCEKKYKDKIIALVGHEYPLWMAEAVLTGWSQEESVSEKERRGNDFIEVGGFDLASYIPASRDGQGFCDYHKPYVDRITLPCEKCGRKMNRIKEVADVWFDSGAMPFAQDHWPFFKNEKEAIKNPGDFITYPADYICEAVDQTRGWFYTLLAVATILGYKTPYNNVVCLGHINDKYGQKMSKSKNNVVDPWTVINKYGIDAVRWYFYNVNAPGESKNFDDDELAKVLRRLMLTIYNSFVFLNLYGNSKIKIGTAPKSANVMDKWILHQTVALCQNVEKRMDKYNFLESGQLIEKFVDDLSRWYIRRSRKRFQKPEDKKDWQQASAVLAYVLLQLSKVMAPFIPFFSEALYQSIKKLYNFDAKDSVHLESWPSAKLSKEGLVFEKQMEDIRSIASAVLAKRSELGIKVRQPLKALKVKNLATKSEYLEQVLEVLKNEVNVKEISVDSKIENDFELDTIITPELRIEGTLREVARVIQDLRQEAACVPRDKIGLWISGAREIEAIIKNNQAPLAKDVGAKKITIGKTEKFDAEIETKVDASKVWIAIKKIK
jgi:isoleucyl-tRNA synthetase